MTNIDYIIKHKDIIEQIPIKRLKELIKTANSKPIEDVLLELKEKADLYFRFDINTNSRAIKYTNARAMITGLIFEKNYKNNYGDKRIYKIKLRQIGQIIGGKHHTTVLNNIKNHRNYIEYDESYKNDYSKFKKFMGEN